jgi:hypothetical protein
VSILRVSTSYGSSREELRHGARQQEAATVLHHRTSPHLKFDFFFFFTSLSLFPSLPNHASPLPRMASPSPLNVAAWQQQLSQAMQEQLQQNRQQTQQIAELHHQLLTMQQEVNSLRLNPVAAASAPHPASQPAAEPARSHNELMRVAKKPDIFRGEHGMHALNWLQELDMFLQNCEPPPSDSQKITLAKSFLRDEALRWWCAREKDVQRAVASGDPNLLQLTPAITTWDAFQCVVKDYFCPRGASDEARNELHGLRQSQFRNLAAYADRFETVSRRIEVPMGQSIEAELIATFKAGLLDGLIRLSLTSTQPRTLFQAIQQAHQAESDLRVAGAHATSGRSDSSRRSYKSPQNAHRYGRGQFGDSRRFGGSSHGPSSYSSGADRVHAHNWSHSHRASGGAVPMDLSAMAAGTQNYSSGSDRESEDDRGEPSRFERQASPMSAGPPAEDASPQSASESAEEFTCASCELNAAQGQRISKASRCSKCGQHMQRPPRAPAGECWNCGQPGHLSRDCPKPRRQTEATSGSRRDGSGKPHRF